MVVTSRELTILLMWAGQWAGEGLNLVIKRIVKQDRPIGVWSLFLHQFTVHMDIQWAMDLATVFHLHIANLWLISRPS